MARFVYEFFRPQVGSTVVFPIGVIAQDRQGVAYVSIPHAPLPEDIDADFYGLDRRAKFMNEDFLTRIEATDPETGERLSISPNDKRLLFVLRQRGNHHFLYGPVRTRAGLAKEVATDEATRLKDKDARREAAMELLDPMTKAALEAYA